MNVLQAHMKEGLMTWNTDASPVSDGAVSDAIGREFVQRIRLRHIEAADRDL